MRYDVRAAIDIDDGYSAQRGDDADVGIAKPLGKFRNCSLARWPAPMSEPANGAAGRLTVCTRAGNYRETTAG